MSSGEQVLPRSALRITVLFAQFRSAKSVPADSAGVLFFLVQLAEAVGEIDREVEPSLSLREIPSRRQRRRIEEQHRIRDRGGAHVVAFTYVFPRTRRESDAGHFARSSGDASGVPGQQLA
jgi:hypothetical protein